MWFVGWVLISCGFMVIKYNNAWWCKIEISTFVGGATPPQKENTGLANSRVRLCG